MVVATYHALIANDDAWLVVSSEQGLGFCHIGPFRESFAPVLVILWYRVELWQI
jgi:hypothetical protein